VSSFYRAIARFFARFERRRWRVLAAVCAVGLIVYGGFMAATVRIEDSWDDIPVQLLVKHTPSPDKRSVIAVYWVQLSDGREIQRPWLLATSDSHGSMFESGATLRVARNVGYFRSTVASELEPGRMVLLVVDGKSEFRFDCRTLFHEHDGGEPPRRLTATLDVDEYLSNRKRVPAIEWPIESARVR
jgi:hypothetical protein